MTVSTSAKKTVAIIGAGLTGLLAAQGLQQVRRSVSFWSFPSQLLLTRVAQNGFRAVVFEQEVSIDARHRDWTILVHWAMPIFEKLVPKDILADLKSAVCNPYLDFNSEVESIPCYNGVTGDLLFRSPLPNARRVSRQALRRLLARSVDIRWNAPLKDLSLSDTGVHIKLGDGSVFDADYVLGTDGSSSKVREFLLGPDASRPHGSGFQFATGITKFGDAEKTDAIVRAHPVAALMMGTTSVGAVGVMSVDNPADESSWTTFWTKIWNGEAVHLRGNEALTYIRENTTPLRDVFQSAIDWTPENSNVFIDEMKYWSPVPWDNHGGRVTLAGDAAHPMLICLFHNSSRKRLCSRRDELTVHFFRSRPRVSALHYRCRQLCQGPDWAERVGQQQCAQRRGTDQLRQ
ncbi:hypothetical protein J3458_000862 [Metarhizium acridum]|uniref:uncharacterized protein n=1 Tax=Metarhizium acridum TaxID=92637 RepID=UPI001C6B1F6B|nr:hypothetical protein J3458_000862 [Metarhizium acridum]